MKAKEENQKMEKENPTTFNLIDSCHTESSTTTTTANSSLLFSSIKLRAWFLCSCRD